MSISLIDYHQFYEISDPLVNRPLRLDTDGSVSGEMAWQLSRGQLTPGQPLRLVAAMGGQPAPILWTRFPPLVCVHQRVVDLLSQHNFKGWDVYPVEVYGRKGEPVPDYYGFAITGRGGEVDISRSQLITKPAPTERGRPYQVYRGVYFHPEQWDGSDLFFVNGHRVVRDTVVKAFKRAKISNVQLTPLPDEEIDVFAYHLSRPRSE